MNPENIIEAALFASAEPLSADKLSQLFPEESRPSLGEIRSHVANLQSTYQDRGVELVEVASGYRFQAKSDSAPFIQRLDERKALRYSRAFLETLALIAYRQPITRAEISEVRGVVVSSNIIRTLMERDWIHVIGFRDVPGKPGLYGTTKKFLDDFGLKSLSELPSLPEIQALDQLEDSLKKQLTLEDLQEAAANVEAAESVSDELDESADVEEISSSSE